MSNPTGRACAGALASTALEAGATGAWVAAGELSPWKRRLSRTGLTAVVAGIGFGLSRPAPNGSVETPEDEARDDETLDDPAGPARRDPVLETVAAGIAIAVMIGSSMLRKRWLAGLDRAGHANPQRALAVRVAAVSFAGTLPARLMEAFSRPRT
jgi:hypothetical protein